MPDLAAQIAAEIRAAVKSGEAREQTAREAKETANKAVSYAKSIAPVLSDAARAGHGKTPEEFRDSIHAEKADDVDEMPACKMVSDVDYAGFLEYGTRNMHEFGTFAQTAKHFGGDMRGGIDGPSDPSDYGDDRGDTPA